MLLICMTWKAPSRLIRYSCQQLKGTFAKTIRQNLKLVMLQRKENSNNPPTLEGHLERGRGALNPPILHHHRVLTQGLYSMTTTGSETPLFLLVFFPFSFLSLPFFFPFFFFLSFFLSFSFSLFSFFPPPFFSF